MMSMLFYRVNKMEVRSEHTFTLSSALYEALLGDNNMPMGVDGAIPVAVEVPLGIIAMLLYKLEKIGKRRLKEAGLDVSNILFWEEQVGEEKVTAAMCELIREPEMLEALTWDFITAAEHGWGGVAYATTGADIE